jgi:hypothetical protein
MKQVKKGFSMKVTSCCRCKQNFIGTQNMLVCYMCRDTEDDIKFSEQIQSLELTHSGDSLEKINTMIKMMDTQRLTLTKPEK